jgi:hypothetical protein
MDPWARGNSQLWEARCRGGQMGNASHADGPQHRRSSAFLPAVAFFVLFSGQVRSQTASTGA